VTAAETSSLGPAATVIQNALWRFGLHVHRAGVLTCAIRDELRSDGLTVSAEPLELPCQASQGLDRLPRAVRPPGFPANGDLRLH
jgi:hypothetical protein